MEEFQKYIDLFLNLKIYKKKYFSVNFQKEFSLFINNFPEIDNDIDKIYDFIKSYHFSENSINSLINLIEKEHLIYFFTYCRNHLNQITEVLNIKNPICEFQKKRIFLGVIWFAIGFYICYLINKFHNLNNFISFKDASNNSYMIFLTCCFVYYDDIFDNLDIDIKLKKIILKYTSYFLENINTFKTIEELENNFIVKNTNLCEKKYLEIKKINKILGILFKKQKKNPNLDILNNIKELFYLESKTSKNQKNTNDVNKILEITIKKSYQSIKTIFICLCPNVDLNKYNITDLIYKLSFLSQLIDDLNDKKIDIFEKKNTIFTLQKNNIYIDNLLNYIYYLKEDFAKYKNCEYLNIINCNLNLFLFNYAISKNKLFYKNIRQYLPILECDIDLIRKKKNNFIKKVEI